ncbi:MAG: hypothetical protein ACREN6_10410 [Gemmatimonadaceae bacterium]
MFRSIWVRVTLVAAIGFSMAALMSGFDTDPAPVRRNIAVFLVFLAVLSVGIAMPRPGRWALRLIAAVIGLFYIAYFIEEAVLLSRGKPQDPSPSSPSALNAARGLLMYSLPFLLFAIGRGHRVRDDESDGSDADPNSIFD